jgi:hypothetical protein
MNVNQTKHRYVFIPYTLVQKNASAGRPTPAVPCRFPFACVTHWLLVRIRIDTA